MARHHDHPSAPKRTRQRFAIDDAPWPLRVSTVETLGHTVTLVAVSLFTVTSLMPVWLLYSDLMLVKLQ